jgi:uncharacterized DUF497 family protein/DNA-binding transcriptional regulator YiaG
VRFTWDPAKNDANVRKHGLSFEEASELFTGQTDYIELFDDAHSTDEERFIAIGAVRRGLVLVAWTERDEDTIRIISARWALPGERQLYLSSSEAIVADIPELTPKDFDRALPASVRRRLQEGRFESGEDVAAVRRFLGLTQAAFAGAMGISVHTLRNWEQGRRHPEGPAIALLRIAARHPKIILENARTAA